MGELVEEPRLADPGLADHGHHLAVPGAGLLERLAELLEFGVAPDEPGEPAGGRRLEARAHRPRRR